MVDARGPRAECPLESHVQGVRSSSTPNGSWQDRWRSFREGLHNRHQGQGKRGSTAQGQAPSELGDAGDKDRRNQQMDQPGRLMQQDTDRESKRHEHAAEAQCDGGAVRKGQAPTKQRALYLRWIAPQARAAIERSSDAQLQRSAGDRGQQQQDGSPHRHAKPARRSATKTQLNKYDGADDAKTRPTPAPGRCARTSMFRSCAWAPTPTFAKKRGGRGGLPRGPIGWTPGSASPPVAEPICRHSLDSEFRNPFGSARNVR